MMLQQHICGAFAGLDRCKPELWLVMILDHAHPKIILILKEHVCLLYFYDNPTTYNYLGVLLKSIPYNCMFSMGNFKERPMHHSKCRKWYGILNLNHNL